MPSVRLGRQTKFQEICSRITDLAYELGPDAKLPTVLQLRDRLGVSIATLNAVLTELEAQRIVRRRHGVGIYVDSSIQHHRVCLICDPSFFRSAGSSPFWGLLVERVRQRAEAARESFAFHFSIHAGDDDVANQRSADNANCPYLSESMVMDIRNGRVDGILGVGLPMVTADWIENQGVPFVSFAGPGHYMFSVDTYELIRQGIGALCQEGCRRIGCWSAIAPFRFVRPGSDAGCQTILKESLDKNGIPFDPDLVWDNFHLVPEDGGMQSLSHQEQGYHAAMEVFGSHTDPADWPDGIFSADDMLTQGMLTALQRLGIDPGKNLRIASHANAGSPALLGWEDKLIRLEVDPGDIVNGMFSTLEALMQGEALPFGETRVPPILRLPGEQN